CQFFTDALNLKSEGMIAFEGARMERQSSKYLAQVQALKKIMKQKAARLHYLEREQEIHAELDHSTETLAPSSQTVQPFNQCQMCGDTQMDQDQSELGPAGCECFLCRDCGND